jgi:hypothetical protein
MGDITATNLLAGAGELYRGEFGAVEPASATPGVELDDEVWINYGATDGGLNMNVDRNFFDLRADQVSDPVGTRQVSRTITLATSLGEITLENLANSWGIDPSAITSGTGYRMLNMTDVDSAEEPDFHALIFRGWAPDRKRRLIIARKVLSVNAVGTAYKKDEQTFIPVSFRCFYISKTVPTLRVLEEAAA